MLTHIQNLCHSVTKYNYYHYYYMFKLVTKGWQGGDKGVTEG